MSKQPLFTKTSLLSFGVTALAIMGGVLIFQQKQTLEKSIQLQTKVAQKALEELSKMNKARVEELRQSPILVKNTNILTNVEALSKMDLTNPQEHHSWERKLNEVNSQIAELLNKTIQHQTVKDSASRLNLTQHLHHIEKIDANLEQRRLNYELERKKLLPLVEKYNRLLIFGQKTVSRLPSSPLYQEHLERIPTSHH
jgi:hypothetical protein